MRERKPLRLAAAPLYKALGRATLLSESSSEWRHVRDRLDEAIGYYEAILDAAKAAGWRMPGELEELAARVVESMDSPSTAMDAVAGLLDAAKKYSTRYLALLHYVIVARLSAGLAGLLAGAHALATAPSTLHALLASLLVTFSLAALLASRTRFAEHMIVAEGAAALAAAASWAPTAAVAAIAAGLAAPLRFFLAAAVEGLPSER